MPHVVFLNHVNNDGTGDYSHAVDVINAIKKLPEMKDCTFSTVISCGKDQAARIRARLGEIESDDNAVFFGVDSDPENKLYEKPEVIASLEKADQVFMISFALNDMPEYDKHFKPQAPKKFIGEHESSNDAFDSLANFKWQDCSMGFGINAHKQTRSGIKLTQTRKQSPKSALESIEKEDKSGFVAALLENTNSATIDDFCSSNHLIPAYFNTRGLDKFFLFLASNPELSDNKNVSIYLSGNNDLQHLTMDQLKGKGIKEIKIIRPGEKKVIYPDDPPDKNGRTITVFQGIYLDNKSYESIYEQASFAGVSGDNTFEKAISYKVFPYYFSTNFIMKRETLEGLAKILKENKKELGIDEKIINDYCLYFENLSMFGRDIQGTSVKFKKAREIFDSPPGRPKLNFKAMIECWPRVADFLFEHHNFYSKLPAICREKLPQQDDKQENKTPAQPLLSGNENKENILPESISDLEISEIKTIFDNYLIHLQKYKNNTDAKLRDKIIITKECIRVLSIENKKSNDDKFREFAGYLETGTPITNLQKLILKRNYWTAVFLTALAAIPAITALFSLIPYAIPRIWEVKGAQEMKKVQDKSVILNKKLH